MKKKIIFIIFLIILSVLVLEDIISIPCPIHFITKLYCPGCGITRMIKSIIKLDFYQAFRYNQLVFILFPFFLFLIIDYLIKIISKKEPIYKKIPEYVWIILIILLLIFGIIRNIFPYFAPTTI
ncbi:MAG: DUF2752 domain-containing protein [Bacilli bacterium]|nr:DUF2752 domain-containing protein [Bacilli bacterium]